MATPRSVPSGLPRTLAQRSRRKARRAERGVAMVEYIVVLVLVFLPLLGGAVLCFDRVNGWYLRFVESVSANSP